MRTQKLLLLLGQEGNKEDVYNALWRGKNAEVLVERKPASEGVQDLRILLCRRTGHREHQEDCVSLVTGGGWGTEMTGSDRDESRDKKFWVQQMELSQKKKCARANKELWYRKVEGINNCWENKECQVLQGVLERGEVRGQSKHNSEKKEKYLLWHELSLGAEDNLSHKEAMVKKYQVLALINRYQCWNEYYTFLSFSFPKVP